MSMLGNILGGSIFSEPFPRVDGISDPVLIAIRKNCQDVVKECKDQSFPLSQLESLKSLVMIPMRRYYGDAFERLWSKARSATDFDNDMKSIAKDTILGTITAVMKLTPASNVAAVGSASSNVTGLAQKAYGELDQGLNKTISRPSAMAYSGQQQGIKIVTGVFGNSALTRTVGRCMGLLMDAFSEAATGRDVLKEFYAKETERITKQYTSSVKWVDDQFDELRNSTFQNGKNTVGLFVKDFFEQHDLVQKLANYTKLDTETIYKNFTDWLNPDVRQFRLNLGLFLSQTEPTLFGVWAKEFVQATGSYDLAR